MLQPDGTPVANFVEEEWNVWLHQMARDGTWGDHISLIGVANAYRVDIQVFKNTGEVHIIKPFTPSESVREITLGHIGEYHYVSMLPKGKPIQLTRSLFSL